jgi:2-iminobutanoate/2-iminopropanoate deaminase
MEYPKSFEIIEPEGMHRAPSYVHAIRAGNTLYIAGQVAYNDQGELLHPNDAAGQAEVVFTNIGKILNAAGADWSNVVKMTTFLIDRADSPVINEIRLRHLSGLRPPHTGLIIAGIGRPEFRLEAEAIAVIED